MAKSTAIDAPEGYSPIDDASVVNLEPIVSNKKRSELNPPSLRVNNDFIDDLEGGARKEAYIPLDENTQKPLEKSGVTVGAGVDLGQWNLESLKSSGIRKETLEKLSPYIGLRQENAKSKLKNRPLTLDDNDLLELNKVTDRNLNSFISDFNKDSSIPFNQLPEKMQTIGASLARQYGSNLKERTPKFYKAITNQNEEAMINELRNFGDKYDTRRNKEADYLEDIQPRSNQEIQQQLKNKGYDVGAVDGIIGNKSTEQIKKFQQDNNLEIDGIPGKNTLKELFSSLNPFAVTEAQASEIPQEQDIPEGYSAIPERYSKINDVPEGYSLPDEELKAQKTPIFERLGKGYGTGVAGMVQGIGGVAKWFGADNIGDSINKYADEMMEFYEIPDPDFTFQVASGIGSMSTFLVPGLGISRGVQALSMMPRLAAWLGVSASSVMEASVEAGGSYNKMIAKGEDHQEASTAATKSFWLNLPVLVFTNKVGIFGENGGVILKGIKSSASEAVQEFTQQLIGNFATKDPLLEGALESAAVGAVVGGGTGALMSVAERKDIEKIKAKDLQEKEVSTQEQSTTVEEVVSEELKPQSEKVAVKEVGIDEQGNKVTQQRNEQGDIIQEQLKDIKSSENIVVAEVDATKISDTESALSYGESIKRNQEKIDELKNNLDKKIAEVDAVHAIENPTDEQLQEGVNLTNEAQLMREAYEKATGTRIDKTEAKESSLIEEAKKYDTVEEFVDSHVKKPEGIKFVRDGDAVGQEYHETVQAIDERTGKILGYVDYVYYKGTNSVKMIEVKPEARRKGVASALLNEVQGDSKKPIDIIGDVITDEGKTLFSNFKDKSQLTSVWNKAQEQKGVSESAQSIQEIKKEPVKIDEKFSKHYERIKEQFGFGEKGVEFDTIEIKNQAKRAFDYIQRNPTKAMRIAYGYDKPPSSVKAQAIRQSMVVSLREAGKVAQAEEIARLASKEITEAAQTLNLAKLDISPKGKPQILRTITDSRLERLGNKLGEVDEVKAKEAANREIKKRSKKAKVDVQNEQETISKGNMAEIDKMIDSLLC